MEKKKPADAAPFSKPQYILFNGDSFRVFAVDLKEDDKTYPNNIEYTWSIITSHFTVVVIMSASVDYCSDSFKHLPPR